MRGLVSVRPSNPHPCESRCNRRDNLEQDNRHHDKTLLTPTDHDRAPPKGNAPFIKKGMDKNDCGTPYDQNGKNTCAHKYPKARFLHHAPPPPYAHQNAR